jgi:exodeoxyribonuclease V alpha subunit
MWHENGHLIGKGSPLSGGAKVSFKGDMSAPKVGGTYTLHGDYQIHPQYGKQFIFTDYEAVKTFPTETEAVKTYLIENVKGVGINTALSLTDIYGGRTLEKVKQSPSITASESGLSLELCERIQQSILEHQEEEQMDVAFNAWFHQAQAPRHLISKLKNKYGNCIDKVKENPYAMIGEVRGFTFRVADQLALSLGIGKDSIERIYAATAHAMDDLNKSEGHTCVEIRELLGEVHELTSCNDSLTKEAIEELINDGVFQRTSDGLIGFNHHIEDEMFIASYCFKKQSDKIPVPYKKSDLNCGGLNHDQVEAVAQAMNQAIFCLTGSAGTGKTTVIKSIIENIEKHEPHNKILLLAPTGKAAKRMSQVTGLPAYTIHKILEYSFDQEVDFQRNENNPLVVDTVIIDEATMCDVSLMGSLLEAIPDATRLILVGDIFQLPSIGVGRVFGDLLKSDAIPSVELLTIHRQDSNGLIIKNAEMVKNGKPMIVPTAEFGNDFYYLQAFTPQAIMEIVTNLMLVRIPERFRVDPLTNVQVLTSSPDKGDLSAKLLNSYLQHKIKGLNPHESEGTETSWLGDKVIQTKNDYRLGIFNGDMGFVVAVNQHNYIVEFEHATIEIPKFGHNLKLAWAISVHKFQGSEAPFIILPIHRSMNNMVTTRNWLYTAITRAKTMCFIVGDWRLTNRMINQKQADLRKTSLGLYLNESRN